MLAGSPNGVDREILSFAGPADAAIAVSFTPYAPATVEYARQVRQPEHAARRHHRQPFSPLALNTSLWFEVVESDFEGFRTLAASMTLAAALAVAVRGTATHRTEA